MMTTTQLNAFKSSKESESRDIAADSQGPGACAVYNYHAFYDYTSLPKDFEDLKEQQQQK
uniref:Uncharacterized protein n=1 Tax=Vitis vinifera TaxID=29760 RepID=F6I0J2_VITVI